MLFHSTSMHMRRRILRGVLPLAILSAVLFLFRSVLLDAAVILFGAAIIAFLLEPIARLFEKRMSRAISALLALTSVAFVLFAALLLLLPTIIRQIHGLIDMIPETVRMIQVWSSAISARLSALLPDVHLAFPPMGTAPFSEFAAGTLIFAGNLAGFFYRFSLMVVLSYFLLCDREKVMIRLELLIPFCFRKTAVKMGHSVCRELKLYLRGQAMIAVAVGLLSSAGLALSGVPSALVLGGFVGILNMIPYFGPVLGGIPAVLIALSVGWRTALFAAAALWLVQQLDSTFISPRILGSLTGLSPGIVLMAIFIGSHFSGIVGMLLALPLVMAIRTVFRVFVQRHENV